MAIRTACLDIMAFGLTLAVRTKQAHQPLGHARNQSLGKEIRMHTHVGQTGNAAPGTVRVQGREQEVSCQGTPDGHLGSVLIANLS